MSNQDASRQVVVVALAGESYGIAVERVQKVTPMRTVTRTDSGADGLISLHGNDIPVVDLRRRLAVQARDESERQCILVADIDGKALGLIVDAVTGVLPIRAGDVRAVSEATSPVDSGCLSGVTGVEAGELWLLELDDVFPQCERAALFAVVPSRAG